MTSIIPLLKGVPITGSGGALGWSSVTLILKDNNKILVDTGFHGNRHHLLQALRDNNVNPHEINKVVLTHMHFDHCLNYDLFPNATFILSKSEYDYVSNGTFHQTGDLFIPDILDRIEKKGLCLFEKQIELGEGISCLLTPGHTPGSATVVVDSPNEDKTAICGDLFKYAWEVNLLAEVPQGTFGKVEDLKESQRNILDIGVTRFICGHDRPFCIREKRIVFDDPESCQLTLFLDTNSSQKTNYKIQLAK